MYKYLGRKVETIILFIQDGNIYLLFRPGKEKRKEKENIHYLLSLLIEQNNFYI